MKTIDKKWFYIRRGIAIGLLALLLLLIPLSASAQTYVKDDYTWVMDGETTVSVHVFDASSNVFYPQSYHSSYTTDGITRHLYALPENAPFAPPNGAWFQIEWNVTLTDNQQSFVGDGKRIEFIYFVRDGYDYFGIDYVMDGDAIVPGKSSFVRFGSTKVYLDEAVEVKKYANYTGYRYSVPCPSGTISIDQVYFSAFYRGNGQASVWSNCFSDIYLRTYTDDPLVGEEFFPPDNAEGEEYENLENGILKDIEQNYNDNVSSIFNANPWTGFASAKTSLAAISAMFDNFLLKVPPLSRLITIAGGMGLAAFVINIVVNFVGRKSG